MPGCASRGALQEQMGSTLYLVTLPHVSCCPVAVVPLGGHALEVMVVVLSEPGPRGLGLTVPRGQ